jgi:hypothetical protein
MKPARFQVVLTSRQLKVKPKQNNIAGLQLADLIAHTSRNEILIENGLIDKHHSPFAAQLIPILSGKNDQAEGRLYGKKLL